MKASLRHLRILHGIGRTGSASRAAAEAHLSQPAVTQAIARLERDLGLPLFERRPTGLFPTEAGAVLIGRIDRAFAILDPALAELAPRLRLTASATQLRALIAVTEAESFSEAARRMGLSQPSVHRAVRQLEAETGRPMFDRTAHGVIATRPVRRLAAAARLMFAELDQALADMDMTRGREVGQIVIGAMPLSRSCLLGPAIARFRADRPGVRLRIVEGPFRDLVAGLRRGEIDLLIGAMRPESEVPDLDQEELLQDRMAILCRPGHPALRLTTPDPARLTGFPFVVAAEGTPARAAFASLFGGPQAEPGQLVETGSLILMRELLRQSDHLGFVSALQAAPEIGSGVLAALPWALDDAPRPIGILRRRNWRPTAAQEAMMAAVRRVAAGLAPPSPSRPNPSPDPSPGPGLSAAASADRHPAG